MKNHSQTLHGTAIYADQLGWFWGINEAAYTACMECLGLTKMLFFPVGSCKCRCLPVIALKTKACSIAVRIEQLGLRFWFLDSKWMMGKPCDCG